MSSEGSEPIADAAATNTGHLTASDEILDSQPIPTRQSDQAATVSNKSVSKDEREALDEVSPHGRRCVLTGENAGAQMAHLIPKATDVVKVRQYQYSFGRKLDLNCRWFNVYLKSDWHGFFDNHPHSWAFIPESTLISQIANKMRAESKRRNLNKIKGPWPDFRGPNWFPTTQEGYTYHFTPLGLAYSEDGIPIIRRKSVFDSSADPDEFDIYKRPYEDLPALELHIHPYAAILNAFPKLEKHLKSWPLPARVNTSFAELKFIHDILTCAYEETGAKAEASTSSPTQGPRRSTSSSTKPSTSAPSAGQSGRPSCAKSRHTNQRTTNSHLCSAKKGVHNDLFDHLDGHSETLYDDLDAVSHELLSNSTPDHLDTPPKEVNSVPSPILNSLFAAFEQGGVAKWVADVERACRHEAVCKPLDDSSPEAAQYAEELARPPPTLDWHDWTSDFAPWWALLPECKKRGILSSNDWVVIHNFPSLTGGLDGNAMV